MKNGILYLLIVYLVLFILGFYLNNMEGFITGRFNNEIKENDFNSFKTAMSSNEGVRRVNERCYSHDMCVSGRCDLKGEYGCKNKCIRKNKEVKGGTPFSRDDPNAHLKNCPAITEYDSGVFTFKAPGIKCRGPYGLKSTDIIKPLKNTSNGSVKSKDDSERRAGMLCMEDSDCKSRRCDTTGQYGCKNKCILKNNQVLGGTPFVKDVPNAHLKNCPIDNGTLAGSLLVDSATTYMPVNKDFKSIRNNINCSR